MKQMNKYSIVILIFIMSGIVFSMTGCFGDVEEVGKLEGLPAEAGTVQLYHATEYGVEPDEKRYQLKQPDNLSAALEEIIEQMQIDSRMKIERYSIDENRNITLYVVGSDSFTDEERLLNNAAIVRSIQNLQVGNVEIVLNDENGQNIDTATYTDSSFYYYEMED